MKKVLLLLVYLTTLSFFLSAQQIENASFEEWEDVGTVKEEPVDWSSIKTTDNTLVNANAPVVWDKSDDARTGLYSVKLINISAFGIVATGIVTNVRVHGSFIATEGYVYTIPDDDQWHTPFTYRPDSLAGWYKYFPEEGDSCVVTCVLHLREGTLPENETQENMVARAEFKSNGETVDTWTRFSVPFEYYKDSVPEYLIITLNGGNKLDAVEGSYALYDDLELVYNDASINEQIRESNAIYEHNNIIYLDRIGDRELEGSVVRVLNLAGQVILEQPVQKKKISLDDGLINQGIYVVVLVTHEKTYSKKIYLD